MQNALVWRPGDDVVFSELEDKIALLDARRNVYYVLDGIGPFVWQKLIEGADLPALCEAATSRFDVDAETARADIVAWLETMTASGLIAECHV